MDQVVPTASEQNEISASLWNKEEIDAIERELVMGKTTENSEEIEENTMRGKWIKSNASGELQLNFFLNISLWFSYDTEKLHYFPLLGDFSKSVATLDFEVPLSALGCTVCAKIEVTMAAFIVKLFSSSFC